LRPSIRRAASLAESDDTRRHPSADEALRFFAGVLPDKIQAVIKEHTESGCPECGRLFGIGWLKEHARSLIQEDARLLQASLNIPALSLDFAAKDEPHELYRQLIEANGLVVVAEQDRDELLVRIRAADGKAIFRVVFIAVLSPIGTFEARIPWEPEHYWPAQHRFPDFSHLAAVEASVNIILSPTSEDGDLPPEGDK
jgi:hypothetical protein